MAESTRRRSSADSAYLVRFGATALILVAGTLILVLVVLPQRYVLSAGFREAGTNFPDPAVPFAPPEPIRVAANPSASVRPPVTRTPADTAAPEEVPPEPGPAELLWSRVLPLIEAGRYEEALRLFEEYLAEYPDDRDVRREYANTLTLAGRPDESVSVLRDLLDERDDPAIRLMLARTLRDMGEVEAAAAEYAILAAHFPDDAGLVLEWAKALAWAERYAEAAELLEEAIRRWPESIALKVELARVYYSADRLEEGRELLKSLTPSQLREAGAQTLLADIEAALFEPEPPPPFVEPEATLLEQAVAAREADDFDRAATLFRRALAEHPDDPAIWRAYADFLEYERGDFEGARNALLEVERLGAADAAIRYRLALLDSWTGRSAEGIARLEALLDDLEDPPTGQSAADSDVTPAAVRALLGDLERWEGDRIEAARSYEEALEEDPEEPRARDGMEALRVEVARVIEDEESPRLGSFAYGLGDTDDYDRFDVAGEWIGIEDEWVWSGTVGRRWVGGPDAAGSTLQGTFLELAPARWWRWGTVRTSARLGAQWLRPDEVDVAVAASALYRSPSEARTVAVQVAHEPAYALTATLQSAIVGLDETRVRAAIDEPLGERWSVAVEGGVSHISASESLADSESSTRLSGTASLARSLSPSWSVGVTTQALTYTQASPSVGGLRLYWDPNLAWTTGPFVRFASDLEGGWSASFSVNPGIGLIDERDGTGTEAVPQLSATGGLAFETSRFRTSIDLFYGLARLEGYRTYGARISFSAGSPSGGTSP